MQFRFDIDGQRATLAVFILTGVWLDFLEKSRAWYGVLPPFKTIECPPLERSCPLPLEVRLLIL